MIPHGLEQTHGLLYNYIVSHEQTRSLCDGFTRFSESAALPKIAVRERKCTVWTFSKKIMIYDHFRSQSSADYD